MKNLTFLTILILWALFSFSQSEKNDLAYSHSKKNSPAIINQTGLINGYIKYYSTQKQFNLKYTNTIKQDDRIQHTFPYYDKLYVKAINQRNTGISLTFLSIPVMVIGVIMNRNSSSKYPYSSQSPVTFQSIGDGGYFILGAGVLFNVGVPLWISGGIKAKNNKIAQEKANLTSFEVSTNGLGMQATLHF